MNQIRTIQTSGSVPTVTQLALGDIAINTVDGKAYIKKYSGSVQSVLEIGSGVVPVSASYAISASYATSASYAATASLADRATQVDVFVKNQSGNTITKGMVVRITGSNNSSDIPRIVTASYENDSNSANTLGIARETIINGSEGFVITEGVLTDINTTDYISGQLIYLGATGSITGSAPMAPLHSVRLGEVIRHQSNNGSIYVRIDNGYELGELHDVLDNTTSGSYGDLLVKSGSVWTNSRQLTGSYSITGSLRATSFTGSISGTASFASTASSINTLNQNVVITSSLAVGLATIGSVENTLTLGPPPAGGTGEGGQIMLAAPGGQYTSASMLDTWQDQFRILRGSNAGSNAGLMYMSLQTGNTQFVGAVTASSYSGLPNDYLYATRATSNQTVGSAWANTDVIFNNVSVSKGISFNTSTGVASLTGGKVYRVTARLAWSAAATYNLQFSCFTSANTQIGPTVEIIQATNGTSNISDGTLDFIYAPGSNTDIKIRCTNNNTALSGEQIRADLNTQFIIQQIA